MNKIYLIRVTFFSLIGMVTWTGVGGGKWYVSIQVGVDDMKKNQLFEMHLTVLNINIWRYFGNNWKTDSNEINVNVAGFVNIIW